MNWRIATDSSCNILDLDTDVESLSYTSVPLTIDIDGTDFVDDELLDIRAFLDAMRNATGTNSSSGPSAGAWREVMSQADATIAVTISSQVSGSYEAATLARSMVLESDPGKQIFVLNSKAAGAKLSIIVARIIEAIAQGKPFREVVSLATKVEEHSKVLYALSSYANLVRNGRLPKTLGALAKTLNMRMLGTADAEGNMAIVGPARGEKKAHRQIVNRMESDGFAGTRADIDHVDNREGAENLREMILARWPAAQVTIRPCRALCSYYAELQGLIIGYEVE